MNNWEPGSGLPGITGGDGTHRPGTAAWNASTIASWLQQVGVDQMGIPRWTGDPIYKDETGNSIFGQVQQQSCIAVGVYEQLRAVKKKAIAHLQASCL